MCLRVRSTTVKTTVVYVEIVVMLQWNWVLLLLTCKVSVENVTCVVR